MYLDLNKLIRFIKNFLYVYLVMFVYFFKNWFWKDVQFFFQIYKIILNLRKVEMFLRKNFGFVLN